MMEEAMVRSLLGDMESDRIERTTSTREDKLGPAVCAFANDFANNRQPGYILLGVKDDGTLAGNVWSDDDLQKIGNVKTNGNVLPQPSLVVSPVFKFPGGDVVVVEVKPSLYPPVRYDGRCWIRVGPRRAMANVDEERLLGEKRVSFAKTFDLQPAFGATVTDLSTDHFLLSYLPLAIDRETIQKNGRSLEEQLASLRFFDFTNTCPTNAGILMFGLNPLFYLPGAYIQYVKVEGGDMAADVQYEKQFSGALITMLAQIDAFIETNVIRVKPVRVTGFKEQYVANYPFWPLRELLMNAIMHRSYESNAPIYIYEFTDRIEVVNPGGLYGDVTKENFPHASDYRNIVLAEALKVLGYVNRYNAGIARAIAELEENGNGSPEFDITLVTKFKVVIPINKNW